VETLARVAAAEWPARRAEDKAARQTWAERAQAKLVRPGAARVPGERWPGRAETREPVRVARPATRGGSGGKGATGAGGALANCSANGDISYTLAQNANPTAQEQMAYERITAAMDRGLEYYNCYTNISRTLSVSYVPSVPTADGNPNGNIRFGSMDSMNYITAMHETSHVLGVGDNAFDALIVDGVFTGPAATAELREITGDTAAELHGDNQHFWPYGLNYVSEVMSEADLLNHMRIVVRIREDMGL
jgi:hypothetical protein